MTSPSVHSNRKWQRNVYPYLSKAKIDPKKIKIGYEMPFTREFYKYVAPRKSEDIFAHLQ